VITEGKERYLSEILKRWSPLFAWIVLIFALSSIPDVTPGDMKLPAGTDKAVHFIEYGILAILFLRGLSYDHKRLSPLLVIAAILTGAGVGYMDELYQSRVAGRDSSYFDLAADIAGVLTGSLLYAARRKRDTGRDRDR
jgi:VanZ family protein